MRATSRSLTLVGLLVLLLTLTPIGGAAGRVPVRQEVDQLTAQYVLTNGCVQQRVVVSTRQSTFMSSDGSAQPSSSAQVDFVRFDSCTGEVFISGSGGVELDEFAVAQNLMEGRLRVHGSISSFQDGRLVPVSGDLTFVPTDMAGGSSSQRGDNPPCTSEGGGTFPCFLVGRSRVGYFVGSVQIDGEDWTVGQPSGGADHWTTTCVLPSGVSTSACWLLVP